ncbi:hypothetical protein SLE2022_329920 [Rubroshorea leprosula]|uniref:Uncharacterized protein n=1 Tax=Rubroshorea leprosula TaxID=152421 RepID=A0AAV5HYY5_9ROSI|nr:hypothetical protein SLEP1_g4594 [Rubroshorea leprosula]
MGRKHLVLVLRLVLLFIVLVSLVHGSRYTHFFKVKPILRNPPPSAISGFLPKGMLIPPSAPSKEHNSIGLQSSSSEFP